MRVKLVVISHSTFLNASNTGAVGPPQRAVVDPKIRGDDIKLILQGDRPAEIKPGRWTTEELRIRKVAWDRGVSDPVELSTLIPTRTVRMIKDRLRRNPF